MSTKQCVNCPGAVDHTTAECPISPERAASSLPAAGSAVEEVEVVAWVNPSDLNLMSRYGYHSCTAKAVKVPCFTEPLMTVAQHERIVAALSAQQSAHVSMPTDAELVEMARKLGARPELCYAEDHHEIRWRIRPAVRALVRALLNGGEA